MKWYSHPDAPEPKPIRALKGVKRIHLQPGEEQIVEFTLTPRNLALVDVDGTTACCPGRISFYIGGSQPVSEADRRQGWFPFGTSLISNHSSPAAAVSSSSEYSVLDFP